MENIEALRAFFSRVTPVLPELFGMAHAICGNYDLAEYALQYTLMEAWLSESRGGVGFRENLRNLLRRVAIEEAIEPRAEMPEFTWNVLGDGSEGIPGEIAARSVEDRRILALHYGCGLNESVISQLTGIEPKQVRERLARFVRGVSAELSREDRRRQEKRLSRWISQQLAREDAAMPSVSTIYRSFSQEALEARRPRYFASKLMRAVLCGVLIFLCALVFWLTAVLVQPTQLDAQSVQATDTISEG